MPAMHIPRQAVVYFPPVIGVGRLMVTGDLLSQDVMVMKNVKCLVTAEK